MRHNKMGQNFKISFIVFFLCLTTLGLVRSPVAQNTPQDYLDAHNRARAQVGVGPMHWDAKVAAYAQNYANKIQRANSCDKFGHSGGPYGENLAAGGGITGRQAVNCWVAEKRYYNYQSNSCTAGRVCGHYTQVVWRMSVRLGCARVRCSSGSWFVICSYDPPGNVVGQRPY